MFSHGVLREALEGLPDVPAAKDQGRLTFVTYSRTMAEGLPY